MTTGQRIKARRDALGMSIRELAKRSGVTHPTLVYLERDERNPTRRTLEKVSMALGLSLADLLDDEKARLAKAILDTLTELVRDLGNSRLALSKYDSHKLAPEEEELFAEEAMLSVEFVMLARDSILAAKSGERLSVDGQ